MKKIQDLGKKFKIIQDYPRSWQENQDAKHCVSTRYDNQYAYFAECDSENAPEVKEITLEFHFNSEGKLFFLKWFLFVSRT